ncbi:MFS transporter [Sphingomonas sp. AR_OL41]|uniref:MFS transporter n=1 Tax=Sphingomonas sp. AR_OL41 TaxID=3042729 RepID=UPI00248020F1|nr:MFS transporter [Sphingomonas sp. AR_OL41]MDH7972121.1 MFS transporter [Sphingomonas sp. AR_OL41]
MSDERLDRGRMAWTVAIGTAVGLAVAFGPAFIATFGLYIKPISAEFGWSRTKVSAIYSLVSIIGAAGTPFLGFLLDRRGSRQVIIVSSIALPCVLMLLPFIPRNYTLFLLVAVAVGLVSIIASPTAYVSLLPQWFSKRLGLAVALAMFGSGFGQFGLALMHGALLARIPWRSAWMVMAAFVAVVGVGAALLTARDRPSLCAIRRAGRSDDLEGQSLLSALRSPIFWTATLAFFFVQLITAAMLTHLAPLMTDRGLGIGQAAGVVAVIGLFSLVGRAVSGALLDRSGFGTLGVILFPMQMVGCLVFASGMGGIAPYVGASCIGLAYGVEADMLPWMLRHAFGLRCFGRLYGIAFGIVQLGSVMGPMVMSVSFDELGSYKIGLACLAVISLVATLLIAVAAQFSKRSIPMAAPAVV